MKKLYTLLALMAIFTFAQAQTGMLDPTFGTGGIVTTSLLTGYNRAEAIAVQTDGKIIVTGNVGLTSNYDVGVARYNVDGSLDNTFGLGGMAIIEVSIFKDFALGIAIQTDGKILITGYTYNNIRSTTILIRLLPNGDLDSSFATGGILNATFGGTFSIMEAIVLQPDGKILLGGVHEDRFAIIRVNTNGTLDNTFGTDGLAKANVGVSLCEIRDIVLQKDGKIVGAGFGFNDFNQFGFAVARFNENGSLDTEFADLGTKLFNIGGGNDFILGVGLQSNDKIILGGHTWLANNPLQHDLAVIRLNADGSIDQTFGNNGSTTTNIVFGSSYATGVVIQPDDKIIMSSNITAQDINHYDIGILRYSPEGALDLTFGTNGITVTDVAVNDDYANAVVLQPDGKIITGGYTYNFDDTSEFLIVRYDNDLVGISRKEAVEFKVFPNPVQNQLTIELANRSSDYQLDIVDLAGRCVYSAILKQSGSINVSTLAKGTYFVRLNSDTETGVTRFIKD